MIPRKCYCCGKESRLIYGLNVPYCSEECIERLKNEAFSPFRKLTNKEFKEYWEKKK